MTNNGKGKVPDTPQPQPKKILPRPPINNSRPNGENSFNASIHALNDWVDESEYLHPNSKGYAKPINDINDHEQSDRMDLLMTKLDVVSTQLAAIINAQPTGENMEEEDYIVRPDIDISESVITTQKIDFKTLQDENLHLKHNLQANVDKLNEAFKVVDMMQHLMINAGQLHDSRRILVVMLEKPKDFYDVEEEFPPQQSQF
ncbi:13755_t:CDS:2 [Funneliformis geosporum]|uniref:13755_t:CDS:1 n=1 Tax=Funneliformis geosporum TaxID=1117311 RepID=A0A9W4T8T0_9GLOM|nr:13755_t:CDS:2 [Funneliformis geosporum]